MQSRTLYVKESLELLRLNYHHSNATFLDPSALLLHSYIRVTASFWIPTRPAPLQAWKMFARTVEWHHTPLNICSSVLSAQHNWQLKTYGTTQMLWLIFSSLMTSDKRKSNWLQQQRQQQTDLVISRSRTWHRATDLCRNICRWLRGLHHIIDVIDNIDLQCLHTDIPHQS